MKISFYWIVIYTLIYAALMIQRHFFGFEYAVITGPAWAIADIVVGGGK